MRGSAVTRKAMLAAVDCAILWGQRHAGSSPPSNPDMMGHPPEPVVALFIQDKTPYDDIRNDFDWNATIRLDPPPVFLIKDAAPHTRAFLEAEGVEYLEYPTNRAYWGDFAPKWRDVEMRYYADIVLEFKPHKPEVKRRRRKKPRGD